MGIGLRFRKAHNRIRWQKKFGKSITQTARCPLRQGDCNEKWPKSGVTDAIGNYRPEGGPPVHARLRNASSGVTRFSGQGMRGSSASSPTAFSRRYSCRLCACVVIALRAGLRRMIGCPRVEAGGISRGFVPATAATVVCPLAGVPALLLPPFAWWVVVSCKIRPRRCSDSARDRYAASTSGSRCRHQPGSAQMKQGRPPVIGSKSSWPAPGGSCGP